MSALITLHVDLQNLAGSELGTVANPASVRYALTGFGGLLPRVPGAAMVAETGPIYKQYIGSAVDIMLWANDQITPAGTWYDIAILDGNGNVIQSGSYQFNAGGSPTTVTFSSAAQYNPPALAQPNGYNVIPFSTTPVFNPLSWQPITIFDMTLTGDVASSTMPNVPPGTLVIFIIRQDGAGGHLFSWPIQCADQLYVPLPANAVAADVYVAANDNKIYGINFYN